LRCSTTCTIQYQPKNANFRDFKRIEVIHDFLKLQFYFFRNKTTLNVSQFLLIHLKPEGTVTTAAKASGSSGIIRAPEY
jgi:hypothetical protein